MKRLAPAFFALVFLFTLSVEAFHRHAAPQPEASCAVCAVTAAARQAPQAAPVAARVARISVVAAFVAPVLVEAEGVSAAARAPPSAA